MSAEVMDLFWRVVRGSQLGLIDQLVHLVMRSPMQTYQELAETIKKLLKNKQESPLVKLQALQVLISTMKHAGFRTYVVERLLTRLTILARKGMQMWGDTKESSQEGTQATKEFARILRIAMQSWAQEYAGEFASAYSLLGQEEVQGGGREEGLEEVRAEALLLREIISAQSAQTAVTVQLSSSLHSKSKYLRSQLPSLALQLDELQLQDYLDVLEIVETTLETHSHLPPPPEKHPDGPQFDFDFDFPQDSSVKPGFDFDLHWKEQSGPQFQMPEFDFEEAQWDLPPDSNLQSKIRVLEDQKEEYRKLIERNEKSLEEQLGQIKTLRGNAFEATQRLQQVQNASKEGFLEAEQLKLQLKTAKINLEKTEVACKRKIQEMEQEITLKDQNIDRFREIVSDLEGKLTNLEPEYVRISEENEKLREKFEAILQEKEKNEQKFANKISILQKNLDQSQEDIQTLVAQISALKLALSKDTKSSSVQTESPLLTLFSAKNFAYFPLKYDKKANLVLEITEKVSIRPKKVAFPRVFIEKIDDLTVNISKKVTFSYSSIEKLPNIIIFPENPPENLSIFSPKGPEMALNDSFHSVEMEKVFEKPEIVISNEGFLSEFFTTDQGVLFQTDVVEVIFRVKTEENKCFLWLLITPKSGYLPEISEVELEEGNQEIAGEIGKKQVQNPLQPAFPAKIFLSFTAKRIFSTPPKLSLSYEIPESITKMTLFLPINFLRFLRPLDSTDVHMISLLWEELKSVNLERGFEGLKSSIRSMGVLRTVLMWEDRLQVLTSMQLPELERTWLLGCGKCLNENMLVLVALKHDASGGVVTTYAYQEDVRRALNEAVMRLISKE